MKSAAGFLRLVFRKGQVRNVKSYMTNDGTPYRLPLDEIVSTTLVVAGFVQLSPAGMPVAKAPADVRFPVGFNKEGHIRGAHQ